MFVSTLPSFLLPLINLFGPMLEDANAGEPELEPTDQPAPQHTDQTADEPNGDLAMVVWPDFVTRAGPDVKSLYEFQIQNGELMKYMPCFCGCVSDGHGSNKDCYIREARADGSFLLEPMSFG